jgi:hypothetical protein
MADFSFDDEVVRRLARETGKTEERIREILRDSITPPRGQPQVHVSESDHTKPPPRR